ncbi:MAG: Ig-like domain-containing protein, partial [Calditrichaeota bacterium]|nr:Ig-like domain-containing protein [Calditrichota bacterium]
MKGRASFLSALLLLLFTTSLLAQHNENSVSVFLNSGNNDRESEPRRDPDQFQEISDWITYDDNQPSGIVDDLENYFSRVVFTPEYDFELHAIQFMVLNDGPNDRAPCYLWVFEEDEDHNLGDRLYSTRINRLDEWDNNIQDNWITVELQENQRAKFEQGQSFSIIYGPAPGGERENVGRGDGWWNIFDRERSGEHSFVARRLEEDHQAWTEYDLEGDILLRAGGVYASDNTSPEWTNVPEDVIEVDEGDRIAFAIYGEDEDDDDELVIEYESDDIPDEVHFEYEQGGNSVRGTFEWETNFEDEGKYEAVFTLTDGEDEVRIVVEIEINDSNCPPEWINVPEAIQVNEEAVIAFWVIGRDNDGDRLEIDYYSEDLPREVIFRDYRYGRGYFSWRTTNEDAGDYTAEFTISDGEAEVTVEVPITVIDTNQPPEWAEYPHENQVSGFVGEELRFDLIARDPENDELEFDWSFIESPDEPAEGHLHIDENEIVFEMEPEAGQHGTYVARFGASDGDNEISIDITIEIFSDHFHYIRSGRGHTMRFENIYFFGETLEWEEDEDNLDEIAVLTEHDQIAGAYRFNGTNDNINNRNRHNREEEGFIFTAWGDLSNTQEVEGFRSDERYHFQFWDSQARDTYETEYKIVGGHEAWRRDGYSVIDLYVGPMLSMSPETNNFGMVEIDANGELNL